MILETDRLTLREFTSADADFILELLNGESFHRYIGDKGVRTLEDAADYLRNGPLACYAEHGFGLYCVELNDTGERVGMCGLLKRDSLDDPDIGFAYLERHWGVGYAVESARAVMLFGHEVCKLNRIVAITSQDNEASIRLLEKIGFSFETLIQIEEGKPEVNLYVSVSGNYET